MTDREKKLLEKLREKEAEEKKEDAKKQRQFKDMCKKQFGHTPTEIGELLKAKKGSETDNKNKLTFFEKVATFYGLKSEDDIQKWCEVMLNDRSKHFWESRNGQPNETEETR